MRRTASVRNSGGSAASTKSKGKVIQPVEPPADLSQLPCVTHEDRIARIQALGRRIDEHVLAVTDTGVLPGTSAESREKAVALFLDRLVFLERALGQTLEDLRLG